MTLAEAKAIGKIHGFSIRHKDGEYRVNLVGGTEDTAYYTDDREDAVNTGIAMAAPKSVAPPQINEGYLVEWEYGMYRDLYRDIFFQSLEIANQVAERIMLNGNRVWMRKAVCVNGYLQK